MAVAPSDTYAAPVDFRITQLSDADTPPEVAKAVAPLYAAMQQVIQTFVNNCGIGPQANGFWEQIAAQAIDSTVLSQNLRRVYMKASETISFGAMVSQHNNAGVLSMRNANATNNTKPVDGFCSTPGGVAAGVAGEFILSTGIVSITGLTLGSRYYLSTTNGLITAVAPVAAGNIEQYLGFAISATKLYLNAQYWIQH